MAKRTQRKRNKRSKNAGVYKPKFTRNLLSNRVRTTMKYSYSGQLNPGTLGSAAVVVYRANDLYDPDFAIGGHQPRGFDQLAALYGSFIVLSSKCSVTFMPGSQQDVSAIVGVTVREDSSALTDVNNYIEDRHVSYRGMSWKADSIVVTKAFNTREHYSLTDPVDDSGYYCTAAASPSIVAFYHIFAGPTYSTDPASLDYQLLITYDVLCTDPVQPAAS